MKVNEYDTVLLKDGRTAAIVEKFDETHFLVDVEDDTKNWDTIDIKIDDIEKVILKNK